MIPSSRRGFIQPLKKLPVIPQSINLPSQLEPIVYWSQKLTHNGITAYKTFENCSRRLHNNSLRNLLTYSGYDNDELNTLIFNFNHAQDENERSRINDQAIAAFNQQEWETFLAKTRQTRHINGGQSRKIRSLCDKLSYYSQTRKFNSSKTGMHSMRIAFLTLTAPPTAEPVQILKAFEIFIDYLARTANCVYVWKKELGELHNSLHFHVVVNNFIPYYIVAWKWKRALISQGVQWPLNEFSQHTTSHYRIELPKSRKAISHYISKYMSKAYDLPGNFGYISGHSKLIDSLKEVVLIENDLNMTELMKVMKVAKCIHMKYVSLIFKDLLQLKDLCPHIFAVFEEQYIRFSKTITLEQKFNYVSENKVNNKLQNNTSVFQLNQLSIQNLSDIN